MTIGFFERVYRLVRQVPPGKVTSYGAIARMLGHPRAARTVGWALHSLPPSIPPMGGDEPASASLSEEDAPPSATLDRRDEHPSATPGRRDEHPSATPGRRDEPPSLPPHGRDEHPSLPPHGGDEHPSLPPSGGDERGGVPWHRVINSQGRISTSCREHSADLQRALLEAEGIEFDEHGTVDWDRFGWEGLPWPEVEELMQV